jgi:ribosomal protein S12 methylthiotransferase accessory factor
MTVTEARPRDTGTADGLPAALAPVLAELGVAAEFARLGVGNALSPEPVVPQPEPDATTVAVRRYGHLVIVGPVRPVGRGGPCPQCLDRRWQVVRSKELRDALELGGATTGVAEPSHETSFVHDAVAGAVRALLADPGLDEDHASVLLVDTSLLLVRRFTLTADPECPRCADLITDDRDTAWPGLDVAPKPSPTTFRLRELDDIALDEQALANPVCGVLGSSVVRELESPTTASTFGKMDLRTGTYLHETFWGGHTVRYRDSVKVGLLEGLERYAGMRSRGKASGTVASLTELVAAGERVVDPRECGLYDDRVYTDPARKVVRFHEDRPIPWVWGRSLRDDVPVLVPELLTYYHSVPLAERFVQECSNGCASGSSLTEAVYGGLMELVERDAFLLTWYAGLQLPEIDPATSTSATSRLLIDRLALHGYRARLFDARITFGIPVVVGVAERFDGGPGRMCVGAGASLDPEDAIRGALIEIATDAPHLPMRTRLNRDRLTPMVTDFTKVTGLHDHPLLYGIPEMRAHAAFLLGERETRSVAATYDGLATPADDLRGDVARCVGELATAGFDTIVVDQTLDLQRRLGVHTASVLVPGLLPIDFGWTRQRCLLLPRLRQAPHAAGFTDHDLTPAELNLAPHPFP